MNPQLAMFDLTPQPTGPCPLQVPGLTQRPTVLLDLNFTLVANSLLKRRQPGLSYAQKIQHETYRLWLVDRLQPYRVILWTVRFECYRVQTLENIRGLADWQPDRAIFNPTNSFEAHEVKRDYLAQIILPEYGDGPYFALESNRLTRAMLAEHHIPAVPIGKADCWTSLPGGDFPPFEREPGEP